MTFTTLEEVKEWAHSLHLNYNQVKMKNLTEISAIRSQLKTKRIERITAEEITKNFEYQANELRSIKDAAYATTKI
jgi:hypothetical protein